MSEEQNSVFTRFIATFKIKAGEQLELLLGEYTHERPAKGYSIVFDTDLPLDQLATEITPQDTNAGYKMILHVANNGRQAVSAEVWQI